MLVKCTSCLEVTKLNTWDTETKNHAACPECDVEVHKHCLIFVSEDENNIIKHSKDYESGY